jgi:hypothetical protein
LRRGSYLCSNRRYPVWSFTTIAVAAKNLMASVPDYLLIERAFTALQWIIVGPLTALAFEPSVARGKPASA